MFSSDITTVTSAIINGEIVIVPTETVYGLICIKTAEEELFKLKRRSDKCPIAYVYSSVQIAMDEFPFISNIIQKLLPGPYTIVVNEKEGETVGIRIPDNKDLLKIIRPINKRLIMTSANFHGHPPAIDFESAKTYFPHLKGFDGGKCKYSKPSDIITVRLRS